MSFALSQRRTDRHPVGLLIVVGLHVVLAAALLSAKLQHPPAREVAIPMQPLDEPAKPTPPKPVDLPPPPHVLPHTIVVVPQDFPTDPPPPDAPRGVPDDGQKPQPVVVASIGPDKPPVSVPHIQARPARLDAGAAQCRPDYPAAAQRAGATGSTRIRFTVDALGRIAGSQILHASGPTREHRLMDQAAAAALAQCPVQVGTDEQGRPVGTTTDVEYVWSLN
ncbi:MAG TPA: TonB family protein [Burkholderiaceae bacterium]